MKNYLSFGGGVNSVATMLLLLDEGIEFEAVYVWMPDWPETHEYLMMLEDKGYPITILLPIVTMRKKRISNLYDYAWGNRMFPQRKPRWCTSKFKLDTFYNYAQTPCFVMMGIDISESHRATLSSINGVENRYPLIEREIDRNKCKEIIKAHGLSVPIKSGCIICPYQRVAQFKELRRKHPDLFCKVVELEKRNNNHRISKGKEPYFTMKKPISKIVNEPDTYLFDDMAYPPCHCGL
ncbi:MAG: hypothetical protein V1843_05085 [bacterium]